MAFTSKTLIPGKQPIGQNKDGSYIYDGVQSTMSVMPSKGTYDTEKQMSVAPKPIWAPPTTLPMVKSPVGFNLMPKVDPTTASKVNAPVEDVKGILQVDKTDPRIQKLEQHFKTLKQKGQLQLNQKQTEYVQRYKKNLPQYANVPDALLFGRIIMKYPEAQEKYGNIGQKGIIESIVGLPLAMAKTGSDAIMEAQDVFTERQKTLNKDGNLGITNLLASASAGRALGTGVMGMAGDVLNVASPFINPETGVTTVTEGLGRDIGTIVGKVPEEYRQQISDLMQKYPKISSTLGVGFDLSNLIPFLGVLGRAKSTAQVDDILRQVKARPATRFRGEVSPEAFQAGMERSLVSDVAQIPVKTTKATLRGAEKTGEFVGETAIATGVGISKPSQQAIKATPEFYKQARTGTLTRETASDEVVSALKKRLGELSDTGKEYQTIRNTDITMPKRDFGKIVDDFLRENDVSYIDLPVKDRKVVQQAIDYIAEYGDNLTAKNGLSLRGKLDDLADWSTEATGEGKRLIRGLRKKVDDYLGNKIPGLKDLDAKYAPEIKFLKKAKAGILNADGTIKDSAISHVANIVGKGKEMKLDRLEQLLPGIGAKVRALKAFEEVQAISSMKTGSIMRQLSGVALGNTILPGLGAIAGFVATNPNIVAFALEKYGMAKKAIAEILKKGAKITPDEAVKVKQAVNAVPKEQVATYLLGAGEQRKLLMPPKQGDSIIKGLSKSDNPTPSSNLPYPTKSVANEQKLLSPPQSPQGKSGKSSVLSQLSKEKSKSAGKKVNNSIIEKLKEKKNNIVEGLKKAKVDTELESLQKIQESMPGVPSIEVPKDYTPIGGLPTGTEFEAPIISSISKTKGKLPSPDVKRPQIRGFDLSTRSSMLESLKEQGMFTDSFFVVKDKNVSNKLFEYAEKKAIKKGNPTSGTKVDMKALVERAENGADTLLTPKEYMKLGKENGVYLRMDIGNGNQVAVNASYADIFFKNFDDVTFKGNNELSPVVVLSKGEPVGVIMPIKDVYSLKGKLGDFSMQSKTPQVEGKTADKIKAMQLEQENMIRKGETPTDDFRTKWNDLQAQYKKEFIDARIAAEKKKVDAAIQEIREKVKDNPDRTDWGRKQIDMEEEGFNNLKKGDYFDKKYQEHIEKIRADAKKTSLVQSVKSKPKSSLPMSQKSEVKYSKPDTLVQEAKKYKSAEEFVKEQGEPIYRGGKANEVLDFNRVPVHNSNSKVSGVYFSKDATKAGDYATAGNRLSRDIISDIKTKYPKNGELAELLYNNGDEGWDIFYKENGGSMKANKILDSEGIDANNISDIVGFIDGAKSPTKIDAGGLFSTNIQTLPESITNKVSGLGIKSKGTKSLYEYSILKDAKIKRVKGIKDADIAKKEGYDGIVFDGGTTTGEEVFVFNPDVIKTKQQLLDIYNKANKKSSLPMASKSEVLYSKPVGKELEPVIKATEESRFVRKPVVIKKNVYRGVSNDEYTGKGMATYGNGLYTTTNKSIAKEYAGKTGKLLEISKTQLPENALHFDTVMDYRNWLDYDVQKKLGMKASEFNAKYPDIGEFVKSLGYDGIVIGKGEIMVTYP